MATRRIDPAVGGIQGRIGELVFYTRKGTPCIRRTPYRTSAFTGAEKENQTRFSLASKFAKAALTDPIQRQRYEKAAFGTGASAQNLAVSDYFRSPVLTEIDLSLYTGRAGEIIRVRAEEGAIGAAEVRVTIGNAVDPALDWGSATVDPDGVTWRFATQQDLPPYQALWITVTARDQPGNRTSKTLRHTTGG